MNHDQLEGEVVSDEPRYELHELSVLSGIDDAVIVDMITYGVLDPSGSNPSEWIFSQLDLLRTRKALRMHNDLGIDWPGLALALDLLDEVERLRDALAQRRSAGAGDASDAQF
jgi:chaperone modulatory protein CbpM